MGRKSSQARGPRSLRTSPTIEPLERRVLLSVDVTTYHNDNTRDGENLDETILTPANVNSTDFGQLFSYPVDGYVYAQPLYMSNLSMGALGTHNVVFVATENDSVYAFDGDTDAGSNASPLWRDSFIDPAAGITTVPSSATGTGDIVPQIGITGTPVIDPSTNTLYVVTNTQDTNQTTGAVTYVQQLHALDITTGAEKFGGPVTIDFSTPGTGSGSVNGEIAFDALVESQRPALTLANGSVYIAWASHGDNGNYHGFIAAYSASTLQFQSVLNVTPNGGKGGIWMTGSGPAVDGDGNLFLTVGNGTFDDGGGDYGDSALKISTSDGLAVADSFTPFNQADLDAGDVDFGSGGIILLPGGEAVSGGKDGNLYVINQDDLGGFGATSNTNLQTLSVTSDGGIYSTPAYFNGTVYIGPENQSIEAYPLSGGLLTGPSSSSPEVYGYPGATPSISANGTSDAIVWTVEYGENAVLYAYDATNLANELYNSNQAGSRDQLGLGVKFAVPTVADGHVYVGTASSLAVFGLLSSGQSVAPATPSGLSASALTPTDVHLSWSESSTNASSFLILRSTDGGSFAQVGSTDGSTTNFDDDSVVVGANYTYEVEASNSAGTSGPSATVNISTPAVAGLVGYWQFNEGIGTTTADASGDNDTGTLHGEVTWIPGRVGPSALNFHGAGVQAAYVDIPSESQLQFSADDSFTLSAWVKANALDSKWAGIVTKSTDVPPGYGLYIDPNNHWAAATSSGVNVIEGPLADTNWHLLTLVQNGAAGTRQFYVDGALVGTGPAEDGSGSGDLWVGGSASTIEQYFNGAVDDVRVYNIALSQPAIEALADVPATPAPGTGVINGTVFEDDGGTGANLQSDPGAPGATVFLDLDDSGVLQSNEPTSVTDSNGDFSFSNLADGTYRVVAIPDNEEYISTPTAAYRTVTISGGQAVSGVDFGETPNNEIAPASQFSIALRSKVPHAVIGGDEGTAVERVTNTSKTTFKAPLELSLFCSASTTLNGKAQVAAGPIISQLTLKRGESRTYTVHFKYPVNLPSGSYYLLGSVIANKSAGETQATFASPAAISLAAPFVSLSSSFRSKGAVAVKPGRSTSALLSIANSGDLTASGLVTIGLFASTDQTLDDDDTPLKTITRRVHIPARHAGVYRIAFTAPAGLLGGQYDLIAQATSHTSVTDANAGNDLAFIATRAG